MTAPGSHCDGSPTDGDALTGVDRPPPRGLRGCRRANGLMARRPAPSGFLGPQPRESSRNPAKGSPTSLQVRKDSEKLIYPLPTPDYEYSTCLSRRKKHTLWGPASPGQNQRNHDATLV